MAMDAEVQAAVPQARGLAILGDFRGRTARTTARYAIVASVLVISGAIARYLEGGDVEPLFSVGFWLVADLLWWSSLRRLQRGDVDGAASRILVGVALIVAVASCFDATILAITAYLLGFPVLQICALAVAPPAHMRLWSRSLPPIFAVLVLSRRVINPLPALEDPIALLTVAVGGALGLVIISRLSLGLLDALRGSLAASEGVRGELAAANHGLEEARDQALAANQAKSAFLATMS
ncbi:MAG: hypothetical protein KC486_30975, partial [Myxococcales bacterium]|nr:hypothetical protein [Myxococcales bacterium]